MNNYIKDNEGFITNSKMSTFMFCPTFYDLKYNQKIVPDYKSDALVFGSAFDLYIQDKKAVNEKYTIVKKKFDPHEKLDKINITMEELTKEIAEIEAKRAEAEKKEYTKSEIKRIETKKKKIETLIEEKKELNKISCKEQLTTTQGTKLVGCMAEFERQPLFDFDSKCAQVSVEIEYKGHKLRGSMDEFYEERKLISDIKTAATIDGLNRTWGDGRTALEKYKDQLSFYQFLVQISFDVLCDGRLQVVTKEAPAKSSFYWADKMSLLDNRRPLIKKLDSMINTIELGIYPSSEDREKCLQCPAYGVCDYSKQEEYIQI